MISSELTYRIFQAAVVLLIGAAISVALYFFFMYSPDVEKEEIELKAVFGRYQATADIYRSRTGSYDGVCEGLLLASDVTCHETDTAYAIETRLSDGQVMCADSTGYRNLQVYTKGNKVHCGL